LQIRGSVDQSRGSFKDYEYELPITQPSNESMLAQVSEAFQKKIEQERLERVELLRRLAVEREKELEMKREEEEKGRQEELEALREIEEKYVISGEDKDGGGQEDGLENKIRQLKEKLALSMNPKNPVPSTKT